MRKSKLRFRLNIHLNFIANPIFSLKLIINKISFISHVLRSSENSKEIYEYTSQENMIRKHLKTVPIALDPKSRK